MLRKLLKYEWKVTSKVLLPVNFIIVCFTIIGCILLSTTLFHNRQTLTLAIFLFILYILSMIALCLITSIYVIVHFYKSLFTAEGYLMFTLPATTGQLLNSKLLTGLFWTIVNSALIIISLVTLTLTARLHSINNRYFSDIPNLYDSTFFMSINGAAHTDFSFEGFFGFSLPQLWLLGLALTVSSCLLGLTLGYMSIVLGQLVEKYKLAASIGFYIAIYMVTQIIFSITLVITSIPQMLEGIDNPQGMTAQLYRTMFPSILIISVVLSIIFYLAALLIMRRKVNLD